jgi:transposase
MTPAGMTVLLATTAVDLRRSFDGLANWVKEALGRDARTERTMYVFVNRRKDMAKVLWRDNTGWCLLSKRLDGREVALPKGIPPGISSLTIDVRALAALLDGVVPQRSDETARSIASAARAAAAQVREKNKQDKTILDN